MQNIDKIILTPDQEELISNLDIFMKDNRCYFGVYGPAGSGKSFTISYFINNACLYDEVILSGTTNNACRVLEQSLDAHNNMTIYEFIKKLNIFISELVVNIELIEKKINIVKNKDDVLLYFNNIKLFAIVLKKKYLSTLNNDDNDNLTDILNDNLDENIERIAEKDKILKCFTQENISEIKNEIHQFISNECTNIIKDKLYIKRVNNLLKNIFTNEKYIRTIHSLLSFEQSRDDNHKIVFLPGKSNIKEIKTKNGTKYEFTPKLTGKRKNMYDNMNEDEKESFDKQHYGICFSKLKDSKLLIIDESSMMKEIEFRYVIYICKILKLKVIFLGDKYQLPPVDDEDETKLNQTIIDYSPAVKLKSSFTLSTIKRTSNPVLQEIYKSFRDLVEKSGQGKVKLHNIQFTKNVNPTDKYLIKNNSEINNIIDYVKLSDTKLENTRILCFSNKEVNKMNNIIRHNLYGDINQKYVIDESLLVTNYMILPRFNIKQLFLIETCLENNNKLHFNYIYHKITENNFPSINNKDDYVHLNEAFKDINKKEYKLKLYTSGLIKIIKIVETQVYVKEKLLNISVVFISHEDIISLFFMFNKKENEYINHILKTEKHLIKLNTDLFRLHKCNDYCNESIKKHVCNECESLPNSCSENPNTCIHYLEICEKENCTLVCNGCYECNPDCLNCVKSHRNNYSTLLWNKYINKEYLLEPSINYSYSTTVHKAQGQSIDNIIVAEYNVANCILFNKEVSEYQKMLIYPTCMYTAVTRAKNILVRLK